MEKEHNLQTADILAAESSESVVSMYDCPVCRKAHLMDLDRLQASSALEPANRFDTAILLGCQLKRDAVSGFHAHRWILT